MHPLHDDLSQLTNWIENCKQVVKWSKVEVIRLGWWQIKHYCSPCLLNIWADIAQQMWCPGKVNFLLIFSPRSSLVCFSLSVCPLIRRKVSCENPSTVQIPESTLHIALHCSFELKIGSHSLESGSNQLKLLASSIYSQFQLGSETKWW